METLQQVDVRIEVAEEPFSTADLSLRVLEPGS